MNYIPYAFIPPKKLATYSQSFRGIAHFLANRFVRFPVQLRQANISLKAEDYLAQAITADLILLLFGWIFVSLPLLQGDFFPFLYVLIFVGVVFIFIQQLYYPTIVAHRRIRQIDRNLLASLRTILVEVNSGVPLFEVLSYIAKSQYGEISKEFLKAVRQIRSGRPQVAVLEDLVSNNPSPHFRRALGQIITGLKTGADVGIVLKEIIDSISREQLLAIEAYGGKLKPLAMFYMLIVAIAPALGVTFLIAILSFLSVSEAGNSIVFYSMMAIVAFFQIMFIGAIRNLRPSLLGD